MAKNMENEMYATMHSTNGKEHGKRDVCNYAFRVSDLRIFSLLIGEYNI